MLEFDIDMTPKRVCGRCGVSWGDYLRDKSEWTECRLPPGLGGVHYKHIWVKYEPPPATTPAPSRQKVAGEVRAWQRARKSRQ